MATPSAPPSEANADVIDCSKTITKTEAKDFDEYIGKAEDLIAAGLVKPDQFPPEGKWSVSYLDGVVMPRRCRMDETYLRICRRHDSNAPWLVCVGLPRGELLKRRAEASEKNRERKTRWASEKAAQDAKQRKEKADRAKRDLDDVPTSERDFLEKAVSGLRGMAFGVFLKRLDEHANWHGGYRFSTETKEAAMLAVDAIVEALMQGEVIFDAERHAQIVAGHQEVIRSTDPSFERQFKALTTPNAAILEGERS